MEEKNKKSILVVGSVAMDTIETPFGRAEKVLGGSAVYFGISAGLFTKINLVGVVGEDFPQNYYELIQTKNINLDGLEKAEGETFFWEGSYSENINEAITKETRLNVFAQFRPKIPEQWSKSDIVFLANIDPDLQLSVLSQVQGKPLVVCDTMNLWIKTKKDSLCELFRHVDIVILNEGEAKLLTGEVMLLKAAKKIKEYGPNWIIIKKGEHGVFAFNGSEFVMLPSYPIEQVVDPTGAGDSFAGGFLGSLSAQPELDRESIRNALLYGTVVASFAIESFSVNRLCEIGLTQIEARLKDFIQKL
ncbi:MAG: PfkB family carbohydrate kinase [Chlamydiota bacterium]|nr:PfkB family carbohydrate kinase [Chlamydiota bacterium]